jgi:ATP diphosphatase
MSQILSECSEVEVHLNDKNKNKLQEEIGDLLHAIFSLCAFNKIDALATLENSVRKFERRFRTVQQLAKDQGYTSLKGESFESLMKFWDAAKTISG